MINFNPNLTFNKSKRMFEYFPAFVKELNNKSSSFLDGFSKSPKLRYPEKYTNGLQIRMIYGSDMRVSIQGLNCGIYITNHAITVYTTGIYHFTVSTEIGKDDIFNLCVSSDILPIAYEDIEFLINFRKEMIRIRNNEKQAV